MLCGAQAFQIKRKSPKSSQKPRKPNMYKDSNDNIAMAALGERGFAEGQEETTSDASSSNGYVKVAASVGAHHHALSQCSEGSDNMSPSRLAGFRTKGQIRVSIQVVNNVLTVHVLQARHLSSSWKTTCDSYVKVFLCPDEASKTQCCTEIAADTNSPTFDKTFSFELMAEDDKKRVMISMWNGEQNRNCSEMLGCMSFGVRHLKSRTKKQPVEGWYYLLSEDLGQRKHLQAPQPQTSLPHRPLPSLPQAQEPHTPRATPAKSDYMDSMTASTVSSASSSSSSDRMTLLLHRVGMGFGFTIKGSCPVRVGRVKEGGAGCTAGLRRGDRLLRINGQDVTTSTGSNVADIVKKCSKVLVVDIQRPKKHVSMRSSDQTSIEITASGSPLDVMYQSAGASSRLCQKLMDSPRQHFQDENLPPVTLASQQSLIKTQWKKECNLLRENLNTTTDCNSCLSDFERTRNENISDGSKASDNSIKSVSDSFVSSPCHTLPLKRVRSIESCSSSNKSDKSERKSRTSSSKPACSKRRLDASSVLKWDPDMSAIPRRESMSSLFFQSPPSICDRTIVPLHVDDSLNESLFSGHHVPNCTVNTEFAEETVMESEIEDTFQSELGDTVVEDVPRSWKRSDMNTTCNTTLNNGHLSHSDDMTSHQRAVAELCMCEQDFASMLQTGVQHFSRPLRYCVLNKEQHAMLFQNIEKLMLLSECHLRSLNAVLMSADSTTNSLTPECPMSHGVGSVYKMRLKVLCQSYESYFEGFTSSLQLLQELHDYTEFKNFVQKSNRAGVSLDAFLQQPTDHIFLLLEHLQGVMATMSSSHHDYHDLQQVIESLSRTCEKVEETANASFDPLPVQHMTSRAPSSAGKPSSINSSQSVCSVASIDSAVLELQQRLTFPRGTKPFQLAKSQRHLVYAGELLHISSDGSLKTVKASLLSDMMLLTQICGDKLQVVEQPLHLLDMVSTNFSCEHPSDFCVTVEVMSDGRRQAKHCYLRATSLEQKCAWKSILEHRVQVCKGQSPHSSWATKEVII